VGAHPIRFVNWPAYDVTGTAYDMAAERRYRIYLQPELEGGYTVTVPALPGCITYGRTVTEAKRMARDAIQAYIVSLQRHDEVVPTDSIGRLAVVTLSRRA